MSARARLIAYFRAKKAAKVAADECECGDCTTSPTVATVRHVPDHYYYTVMNCAYGEPWRVCAEHADWVEEQHAWLLAHNEATKAYGLSSKVVRDR